MRVSFIRFHLTLVAAGLVSALASIAMAARSDPAPLVYAAEVDAIIHPVSAEYITQTVERADAARADLVVITLRTPGGLVDSTRTINSSIIAARTPVAVFVAPSGARAASAGFYILIAADVAAMAPGTHVGAAHPVAPGTGDEGDTVAKKAASDLAAYARSLASQRQRNVELAEQAVFESRSFTEREALEAEPPLIDLVAVDLRDLLEKLDGRTVRRFDGTEVTLRTAGAQVEMGSMTWRQRLLSAIAHPQVALLLFSLGTLGLTIELWNPGGIFPGVVGGICLLLAFFALQILPVNYVGLLLILFGMVLLILEMLVTSFGLLTAGGILSFIFGALMLFDTTAPELQLGLAFILPVTVAFAAIVLFLTRLVVSAHMARSVTGPTGMLDQVAHALTPIEPGQAGRVTTRGEIWNAVSDEPIAEGEQVRVVGVDGLTLTVRRAPRTSH